MSGDLYMSPYIGSGTVATEEGEPDDPYRPELAGAVNAAGDEFFVWLATSSGLDPETGEPKGTTILVEAVRAPTTQPGEPVPWDQMPGTAPAARGAILNVEARRVALKEREALRAALVAQNINPAFMMQPGRTVLDSIQAIAASMGVKDWQPKL